MSEQLKPCPFCGKNVSGYIDEGGLPTYQCSSCNATVWSQDDWQSLPISDDLGLVNGEEVKNNARVSFLRRSMRL